LRDQIVDFVRRWPQKTGISAGRINPHRDHVVAVLGVPRQLVSGADITVRTLADPALIDQNIAVGPPAVELDVRAPVSRRH
jgi:hypothetical protein